MKKHLSLFAILSLLAFGAGCSDDDSPTGGGATDTTPPGIESINAIDTRQLQLTFTEAVNKATAERDENYIIVEQAPSPSKSAAASPGDTVETASAVLGADGKTVTISTWQDMGNNPYEMTVSGVADLAGNTVSEPVSQTFTGSDASDTTPPQIVMRSPAPNETNVGVGESVVVQFSEPMNFSSVFNAFSWTNGGTVAWDFEQEDDNTFVFVPMQPLDNTTSYTVMISTAAMDWAGNVLAGAPVTWNFTTTSTVDNTPPTLVSSIPANGSTNVAVDINLRLTFSEPIDQNVLDVFVTPDIGDGIPVWSNGGRTVTFDPFVDLMDDTQYTLVLAPGGVRDLAGNENTELAQVLWSTGPTFETGSIRGTVAGDPQSTTANDPTGALVIAATDDPFGDDDDFGIGGSSAVAGNDTYAINNLADRWYYALAVLNSNDDGEIDPSLGDAVGLFGIDIGNNDFDPDSVRVTNGQTMTGIDFPLFDPATIIGTVSYTGSMTGNYTYWVGVFDTTGLDLDNLPEPDYGNDGDSWPNSPNYVINELDVGLQPGTYYVGAYLDVNFNQQFDDGIDPAGFFGGINTPTPITLTHGQDAVDIDIPMVDTVARAGAPPLSWAPKSPVDPRRQAFAAWIRQIVEMSGK